MESDALPREFIDFRRVYYVIVHEVYGNLNVVGVGETIREAKQSALDNAPMEPNSKTVKTFRTSYQDCVMYADLGVARQFIKRQSSDGCITLRYCEAKVYIYAKEFGCSELECFLDPNIVNLVRFRKLRSGKHVETFGNSRPPR